MQADAEVVAAAMASPFYAEPLPPVPPSCVLRFAAEELTITSSLLEMTRGGLKGAARRQCRQGGLRDTLEYKLVEVRDGKNAGVQEFSRGYWLDDDLTPGSSRRAV